MIELRRVFLLLAFAVAGCDSGPTSDWPLTDGEDNDDQEPMPGLDGSAGSAMDAGKADAGRGPIDDCSAPDAGDAGRDAGCVLRDF